MLNTPVLFLIFNRPGVTEQVFAQIKKAQPKQLFIAADGPRSNNKSDDELCKQTRAIVLNNIDWPCEVQTLLREKNIGCGKAPAEAITWFFNNVEQGIILEDDCLPANSFFKFCEELLERYKNDDRIAAISGTNLLGQFNTDASYFFSTMGGNWGWASWKRAWLKFDYNITEWNKQSVRDKIKSFIANGDLYNYYFNIFSDLYKNPRYDLWDYQWLFCRLANEGLSIVPSFNQIKNIGFGSNATHTFDSNSKVANLEMHELQYPFVGKQVQANNIYDHIYYEDFIKPYIADKLNLKDKVKRALRSRINILK